jgi:polysaccharide export outer membrane protein
MRGLRTVLFGTLLATLAPRAATQGANGEEAVAARVSKSTTISADYIIGPNDILAVNVWKEAELSRELPVRPDGKVTLPLVGDVKAEGMTAEQLRQELTQRLSSFVSSPEVTVIVQEAKSKRFNIVGEVQRPGVYPLTHRMTVLDAIAMAGGFRDFAKTKKIYVLRLAVDGSQSRLPFNYRQVINGKRFEQNVTLESGDTIVVP